MNLQAVIQRFAQNATVFEGLLLGSAIEETTFKVTPEKWSLLEIVNHLLDEEREDFRQRLDLTLHAPGRVWPAIDPQHWVRERAYAERDFEESLEGFLAERQRSLDWLSTLKNPAWDHAHEHPTLGRLSAGDLLVSWLAHDALHMRQILRLQWEYRKRQQSPYCSEYAGSW